MGLRRAGVVWIASLVLLGCEQMPWASSKKHSEAPTSAPASATIIGVAKPEVAATDVVAKVNDGVISKRDVELLIQELRSAREAAGQTWTPLSEDEQADKYDLHDAVNDLITLELRNQDAMARGLDRDAKLQQRFAYVARTMFAQEWLAWQFNRVAVTPEEIDQFYQQNQWGFREPERVKLRQLVVASEDQAKAVLVKLLEGMDFVEVARQSSVRPEAAQSPLADKWVMRSGDKAVFAPNNDSVRDLRDPVLEQAAFAIDKTQGVSSYVKGADGNDHIFQLLERQPGRQRPLVEVSDNIRNFLRLQKLNSMTEGLRTKAHVERFPERVKGVSQ